DFFSTLRGRLGFVVHPGFMFYGTAGYSLLGAEYKRAGIAITTTNSTKKYGTMGGFVYGGGLEYDMGWGIGFVEYLHSDGSDWNFVALGGSGNRISIDSSQDVVRVGMKFKVGHDY
ncbi:unnamed protein product, partial [Phaeothamnion confervicola]